MGEYKFVERPDDYRSERSVKFTALWGALLLTLENGQAVSLGPEGESNAAYQAMLSRARKQLVQFHARTVKGIRVGWLTRREVKP